MAALNVEAVCTEIIPLPFFDPEEDVAKERVLFDGLLGASDLTVWIGREKHRKTNVMLQLAICAALGRDFMTFRYRGGEPARVAYVDYETKTASLKHRYEAICRAMGLTDEERKCLKRNLRIIEVRKVRVAGKPFPRFPRSEAATKEDQFWREFIKQNPADLYLIDPMRCFHGGEETDLEIEKLLEQVRRHFGQAAVIISHHMRKLTDKRGETRLTLSSPGVMREWSDGARGEWCNQSPRGRDHLSRTEDGRGDRGGLLRGVHERRTDIEPIPLTETDDGSFLFKPSSRVPTFLRGSFDLLKDAAFHDRAAAADILQQHGVARSTAYKHVSRLCELGSIHILDTPMTEVT